jgi:hypothetical protein
MRGGGPSEQLSEPRQKIRDRGRVPRAASCCLHAALVQCLSDPLERHDALAAHLFDYRPQVLRVRVQAAKGVSGVRRARGFPEGEGILWSGVAEAGPRAMR